MSWTYDDNQTVTDFAGNALSGRQYQIWTSPTGVQIKGTLTSMTGAALPDYVTSNTKGEVAFKETSETYPVLYRKAPDGTFSKVLAVEPLTAAASLVGSDGKLRDDKSPAVILKKSGPVSGKFFGIGVSNGGTADDSKWADALSALGTSDVPSNELELTPGSTSRITAGLSRTTPVVIKGMGAKLIPDFNGNALQLSGTYGTPVAVSAITVSSPTENGGATGPTHVLTTASAQAWKPGQWVQVYSDDIIPEARPGSEGIESRLGEFAVVRSVNGAAVTLGGLLREAYTTNVRAVATSSERSELHNLIVESPNFDTLAYTNALIVMSRLDNPVVKGLLVRGAPATALIMKSCLGYDVKMKVDFARNNPGGGQYGYGLNDNSSSFGRAHILFGYGRHGFTDDTNRIAAGTTDPTNYGRSYSSAIDLRSVGSSAQACDTHACGEGHQLNVIASDSASAYAVQLRGRRHEVRVTATRMRGALAVFEESAGGFTYGMLADKVVARDCSEAAIKVVLAPTGHPVGAGTRRTDNVALTVSGEIIVRGTPRALDVSNAVVVVDDLNAKAVAVQPADFPDLVLNTNSEIRGHDWRLDLTGNTTNEPTPFRTASGAPTPCAYDLEGWSVIASDDSANRVVDVFSGPNSVKLRLRRGRLSHRFTGQVLGSYDLAGSSVQFAIDNSDVSSAYLFKAATAFVSGTDLLPELASIADPVVYCHVNPSGTDSNIGVLTAGKRRGQRLVLSLTAAGGSLTLSPSLANRVATATGAATTITGLGAQWEASWDGNYWREVGNAKQGYETALGLLASGQETVPRLLVNIATVAMTSQLARFAIFTARKSQTVTSLRVHGGTTAAGAAPTLARAALYSVDGSGNLTLMSATASDTALFATANTAYARALAAAQAVVAGQQYAVAELVVTTATAPTVACAQAALSASEAGQGPAMAKTISGQADLAASYSAGSLSNSTAVPYAVLVP